MYPPPHRPPPPEEGVILFGNNEDQACERSVLLASSRFKLEVIELCANYLLSNSVNVILKHVMINYACM